MDLCRTVISARRRVLWGTAVATLAALPIATRAVAASGACERLRDVILRDGSVTAAEVVAPNASPYAPREFCRVRVTTSPTRDSEIKTEVWLPTRNWNGKL